MDGVVPAPPSPKKKPRPNVLRQLYALSAIHQFEPVRASLSSALSPHSTNHSAAGDAFVPTAASPSTIKLTAQSPPSRPRGDDKASPRLRPYLPPATEAPSAASASRADQDLFRYRQGVEQRLAIRPLFEQRREVEADMARQMLAFTENDPVRSRQSRRPNKDHESLGSDEEARISSSSPRAMTNSNPGHVTTPVAASEMNGLQATAPRGATEQDGYSSEFRGPSTDRSTGEHERERSPADEVPGCDESSPVESRLRIPSPSSSAGPNRLHVVENELVTAVPASCESTLGGSAEYECSQSGTPPNSAQQVAVKERNTLSGIGDGNLVRPLNASALYAPFLEKRRSNMNWLTRKFSFVQAPTRADGGTTPRLTAPKLRNKVLWKDTKTLTRTHSAEMDTYEMRVLLGSSGRAHIAIRQSGGSGGEPEEKVVVSESDLLVSTEARPDLAALTPKWAKWLLTRLERDMRSEWFLRIQSIEAMDDACVFSDDVRIPAPPGCGDPDDEEELAVGVSIYLLDSGEPNSEALLVHARDRSSATPSLTELVLKNHELAALAMGLGYPRVSIETTSDVDSSAHEQLHGLLRDKDFLRRAIAESKALRLAVRGGLHTAQAITLVTDLPFRMNTRAASSTCSGSDESREGNLAETTDTCIGEKISRTISEYEAQGLSYATTDLRPVIRSNEQISEVAFLSQTYYEDAAAAALRWIQRKQAVDRCLESYVHEANEDVPGSAEDSKRLRNLINAAKRAKLEDLGAQSIIENMINDIIAVGCRLELRHAKFMGGFDDFCASKVQSTFRMSYQRRNYVNKRNACLRAVRLIQALQRGIIARRRYGEIRVERATYWYFGFNSSLHQATTTVEDPQRRATNTVCETERRRQAFLMQVMLGYVVEHSLPTPLRIPTELARSLFNEYGVVVGCSPTLGDSVAEILASSRGSRPLPMEAEAKAPPLRLFGTGEIHAALLTALRIQSDGSHGESSSIRRIATSENLRMKAHIVVTSKQQNSFGAVSDENAPPRWLPKANPTFQRTNRNRSASLRLKQKSAGQRAAHLVALNYRKLMHERFHVFNICRAVLEDDIRGRRQQTQLYDAFSVDELAQYALEKLTSAVNDVGIDPEPLFEALNLCLLHRFGKQAISLSEQAFDKFAHEVNAMHSMRNVYPLRREISQALEEFEILLALRCLNITNDSVVAVPPSEILHLLLNGKVNEKYLRYALPSVLPIAEVNDKVQLADKLMRGYANASHGEAFNAICWSCLDTADNVTVEAARFLERITRHPTAVDEEDDCTSLPTDSKGASSTRLLSAATTTTRALGLLTGSLALRFLQFLAKTARFNKSLQRRVLDHLDPYARDYELYRLVRVLCSIENHEVVTWLFDESFSAASVHDATRFWVQYAALYGDECAELARTSCCAT